MHVPCLSVPAIMRAQKGCKIHTDAIVDNAVTLPEHNVA